MVPSAEHGKPHGLLGALKGGALINDHGLVGRVKWAYRSGGRRKIKKLRTVCNGPDRVVGTVAPSCTSW